MRQIPDVQSVMTVCPHSIGLDQSLKVAKDLMRTHSIRHLPVQDGGELVGIVTDRDINFALAMDQKEPDDLTIDEVYTSEPFIVEPTASLDAVVKRMADDHLGCALVTDNGKLVGIFTTVDACRTLGNLLAERK